MSEEQEFSAKIDQFRRQVQEMPNDASPEIIEKRASYAVIIALEGINYAPPVIIEKMHTGADFYYKKLALLRQGCA
jgi:hypothetical protein